MSAPLQPPTHEILHHPSEVRLRLRAGSLPDLFAEAGRALAQLQLPAGAPAPGGTWRTVEVSATDRAALLVDWLNELIFLAETEGWIGAEFEVERAEDRTLRVRARGVSVDRVPTFVKAATLHGVRVDATLDGVEGEVILDV